MRRIMVKNNKVADKREEQMKLYDALETLNDIDQQIIHAYVLENKSYSKIAKEIGLSDKTVKNRFVLALQSLKKLFE
ncbi:sigma-70 family RNA polymerase sigma factor [Listeria monocytogenes]|nr:sigma-70 family RNA polymerase sigma factor [Listeria monocytogenes]ELX9346951.1 sigma-70 family RNA polymerase sigma factor [Listeria monocytogenes]